VTGNADHVRDRLLKLQDELSIIREVRVCGMMIGIELSIPSGPAVGLCMERGVLVNATQDTVVRLLPALNIRRDDLNQGLDAVTEALKQMAEQAAEE